jgi:hypothetical protein
MFASPIQPAPQAAAGAAIGLAAGIIVLLIVTRFKIFKGVLDMISEVQASVGLTHVQWAFLSLAAALGEETLFRGALQPLMGILLSSVLFILLHGYLTSKDSGMRIMGVLLFGLSCVLGLLFREMGMIAAISCHFFYDLTLTTGLMLTGNLPDPENQDS